MTDEKAQVFNCWAVVELFGHQKIAGAVSEQSIAGTAMLRVDVPANGTQEAFTRFFGHGAIYSINPTTEEIARRMASQLSPVPVHRYELPAPEGEPEPEQEEHDDSGF